LESFRRFVNSSTPGSSASPAPNIPKP
jgi:hypothetical protein